MFFCVAVESGSAYREFRGHAEAGTAPPIGEWILGFTLSGWSHVSTWRELHGPGIDVKKPATSPEVCDKSRGPRISYLRPTNLARSRAVVR